MFAYDRLYLEKTRTALGRMLDYAVYDLKIRLSDFWNRFLDSPVSGYMESGVAEYTVGKSGVELAMEVMGEKELTSIPAFSMNRSEEYWTGWTLAYYQWKTGLSFGQITQVVSIDEIRGMYSPYHEMDVLQFCDAMDQLLRERNRESNLKRIRTAAGLSQSQLAEETEIPIRTIQQYEQGQKSINRANAEYLIRLSKALYCDPAKLLEYDGQRASQLEYQR